MAAKGSTFDNDLLKLIFNGTAIANIADNTATSPLTNLYISLHTGTVSAGSSQTTSEAAYTSYGRVAVPRTTGGFTVNGATVNPVSTISFPTATAGSETETYFAIGTASTGTGKILYYGTISPSITVSNGVTPQLATGSNVTES
jgi:hypothetical protein